MYNNSTKILGNKKCPSCQQTLDVESCFEFHKHGQYKHICKKCDNGL